MVSTTTIDIDTDLHHIDISDAHPHRKNTRIVQVTALVQGTR
jgi:hypothetical protein